MGEISSFDFLTSFFSESRPSFSFSRPHQTIATHSNPCFSDASTLRSSARDLVRLHIFSLVSSKLSTRNCSRKAGLLILNFGVLPTPALVTSVFCSVSLPCTTSSHLKAQEVQATVYVLPLSVLSPTAVHGARPVPRARGLTRRPPSVDAETSATTRASFRSVCSATVHQGDWPKWVPTPIPARCRRRGTKH